jgi:hypothetical protein
VTASEWRVLTERTSTPIPEIAKLVPDILADLAEMENLAIGGEGSTHWYWRDEAERLKVDLDEARMELTDIHESLDQALIQNTRIEAKNEDLTRTVDDLMQERHDAEEGSREVNSAGGERKHTMRFEDRMMFWDGDDNDADLMCSNLLGWIMGLAEVVNHNADLLGCHLAAAARIEARRKAHDSK